MPLVATRGAASAQAFGEFSQATRVYIEDVFSTYLYTGNGSTQTITNGIDLAGKGGLVWIKNRNGTADHFLQDTSRGVNNYLNSNNTNAASTLAGINFSFNSSGFSQNNAYAGFNANSSGQTYVSWTFREQAKFFDVVTYTGDGANYRAISHSLGSTPGMVIVKSTSASGAWAVWHRSVTPNNLILNSTSAAISGQYSIQDVTSANFAVANSSFYGFPQSIPVNDNGATYVAYLFAHDAGGFGASGSDNVISCGSYTGNGSTTGPVVTLGYEPQWLLIKRTDAADSWYLFDVMRGLALTGNNPALFAELSSAEVGVDRMQPLSTGFTTRSSAASVNASGGTYIYIAIRRGPMKTPTTGTSVYNGIARTGTGVAATVTGVGFAPDFVMAKHRTATSLTYEADRLRGRAAYISPSSTNAEVTTSGSTQDLTSFDMDGFSVGTVSNWDINGNGATYINWCFRRAPGFFDVVCYTGTGANRTVSHNLGVVPELMIFKERGGAGNWLCYHTGLGATKGVFLNLTNTPSTSTTFFNDTSPTNTVFTVGTSSLSNSNLATYVAYLFASCPGVSKVGSYTGTGNVLQIDCGFTGGARFVLIKRTDSTGDWYVWDSARGIVAGNDPYLLLNSTAAEVTTTDWVDTYSAGFELSNAGGNNANINGASYIFLSVS